MEERLDRKRIIEYGAPTDHALLMAAVDEFAARYTNLEITMLGQSILGRKIPILRVGRGEKKVLYVGAHHGMEWVTGTVLLRFVNEYCELLRSHGRVNGLSVEALDEARSIYVIPMLNPDGVEYALHGIEEDNPLYERAFCMNGQSMDFSHWQANARGVDLNHNYNAGFAEYKRLERDKGILGGAPTRFSGEAPESEPEVGYLCNFIRFHDDFSMALTLHTQGEEIYYTSGGEVPPKGEQIGARLCALCGYTLAKPEGMAAYGGFTDWFIREFGRPSFTIECGKGENPLPFSDFPMMYLRLRKMLFAAPFLV